MNKLILDIGNTTAKAAIVHREKIVAVHRYELFDEKALHALLAQYRPGSAIVAAVRKNNNSELELLQQQLKKVLVVTHKTPLPIGNLYATPDTLGVDRLAAAVGANYLFPRRDCLVIDCGTAITIDFVSSAGEFLGGNISPGLQTRFKALHHYTEQLPLGTINDTIVPIGTTTREAVETGVLQGALNELEGYMDNYSAATAILTGGDAFYFAKKIKKPIFVVCNLNFIGLAKIADYNAHI